MAALTACSGFDPLKEKSNRPENDPGAFVFEVNKTVGI